MLGDVDIAQGEGAFNVENFKICEKIVIDGRGISSHAMPCLREFRASNRSKVWEGRYHGISALVRSCSEEGEIKKGEFRNSFNCA